MRALLFALLLAPSAAQAAQLDTAAPWPMFRHDPQHTSSTTLSGPTLPKMSWRYKLSGIAGARSFQGVSVGSDGTIYTGGDQVVAINPNGTTKWTYGGGNGNSFTQPLLLNNGMVYVSSRQAITAIPIAGPPASWQLTYPTLAGRTTGQAELNVDSNGNILVSNGDELTVTGGETVAMLKSVSPAGAENWTRSFVASFFDVRASGVVVTTDSLRACWRYQNSTAPNCMKTSDGTDTTNLFVNDGAQRDGFSLFPNGSYMHFDRDGPNTFGFGANAWMLELYNGISLTWTKSDYSWGSVSGPNASWAAHTPALGGDATAYMLGRPAEIFAISASTGGFLWRYSPSAYGFTLNDNSVSPITRDATNVYFTYCTFTAQNATRLASLNAASGALNWDIVLSTGSTCNVSQPVIGTGQRMYVHTGDEVIGIEQNESIAISVATAAASALAPAAGTAYWSSTATVSLTKIGGLPVSSGVVVEMTQFGTTAGNGLGAIITPSATNFLLTDTAGQARFPVTLSFPMSFPATGLAPIVSTISLRSSSLPIQNVFLRESRVASVVVSTQTPALAGTVRFSTMTFTVRDNLSAPLSNVPCISRASGTPYPGSTSMSASPNQAFWLTDGAGLASIVFGDDLSGLNNDNYAVYAVTHTVACLGSTSQQVVMKEHRVATVQISTGSAGIEISGGGNYARISTVTVTLRDSLGAVVPGVPVALDLAASPAPITITPNAVGFTTATNASGQASFFVQEFLQGVDPNAYATMASTLTLRVLSFPDQSVVLREERVATVTVATSAPVMQGSVRVITATVTVRDTAGALLPQIPVGLNSQNFGSITTYSMYSAAFGSIGRAPTSALGIATFTIRQDVLSAAFSAAFGFGQFANFSSSHTVSVPQRPDQTLGTREIRAASFTVSYSSTSVDSDLRYATMTVTVRDALSNPVANVPVAVSSYTRAGVPAFEKLSMDPALAGDFAGAVTNALGQANFTLKLGTIMTDYDTFDDFIATVAFVPMSVPAATSFFLIESNRLDHYVVSVPTIPVSVGVAFVSTITAANAYNHRLSSYTQSGVNLIPLFAGTNVQGTGSLGTNVTGAFTEGRFQIAAQTYNKVENIDIKASRSSDGKSGRSPALTIQGPHHFIVTVPTAAAAGTAFSMTITAVDAASTPVVGYAATISLSALKASNPALSGAGVLGVTNVNMPANGTITIANQTYTKAEAILIRAADTGAAVVGQSTYSAVVGAGAPESITLLANPQSTISGVPSALTATILDGFSNPVTNSTATFSVATGSGVVSLSLSNGAVVSAVTSTQAVTDAFGQATAFFSSTNSLSAQANLLRASLGGLARDTTVYSAVLVTAAGGAVVNSGDPRLRAECPANTYGFAVRLSLQSKAELSAADLALTTAAFAATANTFVSTTVLKISAVRDASPGVAAGPGGRLMKVSMPYVVTSGSISVGSFGAQSILVPLSVMRIFRLNQVSNAFEQVLDGASGVDSAAGTVTAEVSDPDGIYALGAPAFTTLAAGSSATVTTALAGGTSAQVVVPLGGFAAPATISVTVPGASSVPALPSRPGLTGLGITVSVTAGGLQPASPVTLKIGYRLVDVAGINPDHLRLARYDAATGWTVLDSGADTEARQVVGQTDHFSLFQIVAQTPSQSVADGFVFPNPFRPSLGHTNIKLSSLPAAARVKIFTATGRLLKELDADAAGQVLTWNGADRDGRALASGVYLAVIEGKGGRRTIKFAVQR